VLGQRRRNSNGGDGVFAEVVVGEFENEGGIDAAGVGDDHPIEAFNEGLEFGALEFGSDEVASNIEPRTSNIEIY